MKSLLTGFGLVNKSESTFKPISLNSGRLLGFDTVFNNKIQDNQKLIDEGYGGNVSLFAIINKIVTTASSVASDNLIVVDENDELVENGYVFDLLQQPAIYRGEQLDTSEWVEVALTYLLLSGNLYQKNLDLVGFKDVLGYEIIPSGIVEPITANSYLTHCAGFKINDKQSTISLPYEEVNHLKYINPTTFGLDYSVGLSPLQAGLYSLTGSTDVQKALSVMVKNQGVRGILTNKSERNGGGVRMDNDQAKTIKTAINNTIRGIDKINSVHITNADLSYLAMGMSAGDLKLIESGVLTDRQLCNMFSVDSKLFNDTSSSTFNNVSEANKSMYQNAIIPNLNKLIGGFNKDLVKELNKQHGTKHRVIIDVDNIEALQKDQKLLADKNKLNADGIANVLNSNTDADGKIEILKYTYQMTDEVATNIVGNGTNESTED
jgi:HK97 family phage portal protein